MRNVVFFLVLVCAVAFTAGCTGVSGPSQIHSGTPNGTMETLAPDITPESRSQDNGTPDPGCIGNTGETRSYPANITDMNKNPMSRTQFFEANREYYRFLVKELGEEKAKKMLNDEYIRGAKYTLLDPSSGDDTLISIVIDPVEVRVAGEIVNITGSTNLPPGRELSLVIFRGNYDRSISPCEDPWHDPVVRRAVVKAGRSSEKNTWSYLMNTTGLVPDDYLVYVRETKNEGAFLTNTMFHLYQR